MINNENMNKVEKATDNNRICNSCKKNDVCMYKSELERAVTDINQVSERTNVFINTNIMCKHWLGEIVNYR